jgi:hypothetical protein
MVEICAFSSPHVTRSPVGESGLIKKTIQNSTLPERTAAWTIIFAHFFSDATNIAKKYELHSICKAINLSRATTKRFPTRPAGR